jgi:hypothetical protein
MEQELRFGLVLGITEKKVWADYEQRLRAVFYVFMTKKKLKLFLKIF